MDKIDVHRIADLMRDNIINAYTDYHYLFAIADKLDLKGIPIIGKSLIDYCSFIEEILETIKRDLTNCLYKLLYDGNGKNFRCFLTTFNLQTQYQDYKILSGEEADNIYGLRNEYMDHISPREVEYKIELKNVLPQIMKLIDIYNDVVKNDSSLKQIKYEYLERVKTGIKNGVNLMFDNETHKIIYK